MCGTWRSAPPLFVGIGTAFDVAVLRDTLGRSCAIVLLGLAARLPAASRDRLFVAAAWTPKATAQAALADNVLAALAARGARGAACAGCAAQIRAKAASDEAARDEAA